MSEAVRQPGLRGKLPPGNLRNLKSFEHYLTAPLPTPPTTFDYAPRVIGGFPMACNDKLGDCTIAGVVHLLQLCYAEVTQPFTYPGDAAVQSAYFGITGGQDTGCVETTVLNLWETKGLFNTKLAGWAPIDITNHALMAQAAYAFGGLYFGVELPQDAETQFSQGQRWTLQPGSHPPVGGHCVVGSGVAVTGPDDITWAAEDGFTWDWWKVYGSECYVVIPEVFLDVGHGPVSSINISLLQEDLTAWKAGS